MRMKKSISNLLEDMSKPLGVSLSLCLLFCLSLFCSLFVFLEVFTCINCLYRKMLHIIYVLKNDLLHQSVLLNTLICHPYVISSWRMCSKHCILLLATQPLCLCFIIFSVAQIICYTQIETVFLCLWGKWHLLFPLFRTACYFFFLLSFFFSICILWYLQKYLR